MNCEHYQLMISEFMDDELASKEMTPLFAHLAECGACRGTLQEFINLRAALMTAQVKPMEREQARAARKRSFSDASSRLSSILRRRVEVPVPTIVLAAAAILAVLSFFTVSRFGAEDVQRTPRRVYVISEPVETHGYYSSHSRGEQ